MAAVVAGYTNKHLKPQRKTIINIIVNKATTENVVVILLKTGVGQTYTGGGAGAKTGTANGTGTGAGAAAVTAAGLITEITATGDWGATGGEANGTGGFDDCVMAFVMLAMMSLIVCCMFGCCG